MAGSLTTHVLDTARGCPAAGLRIELFRIEGEARELVSEAVTNTDGRTDGPMLGEDAFAPGSYELRFHAGVYLEATGAPAPRFLDVIPLQFTLSQPEHYHVPLLLAPFGYTTYRGS